MTQFNTLVSFLAARTKSDRGAAMVEYALLLALIAVIAIAALKVLGGQVKGEFEDISSELASV